MKKCKKAFTLAELLIVLVAIGFILIMQLIVLTGKINQYGNPYYTTYNALRRATYNVLADIYCPDCYTTAGKTPQCTANHICPDFARTFPTTTREMCTRLTEFINTSENNCSTATAINNNASNFETDDNTLQFRATNGQKFYISEPKQVEDAQGKSLDFFVVYVDLNGDSRPNRLTCQEGSEILPDIVPFAVTTRGDIVPIGFPTYSKTYLTATVKYPTEAEEATAGTTTIASNTNDSARMTYNQAVALAWPSETAGVPYRDENIPYSLMFDVYGSNDMRNSNITQCYRSKILTGGTTPSTSTEGCEGGNYTCRVVIDKFATSRY